MRYLRYSAGPIITTRIVLLDGDESSLPDAVLMMMAAGKPRLESERRYERGENPGHYGGYVEIRKGRKTNRLYAKVLVYAG